MVVGPTGADMNELFVALGLVLVIEGAIYALFPEAMQRMLVTVLEMAPATLRTAGLFSALLGFVIVWLVKA